MAETVNAESKAISLKGYGEASILLAWTFTSKVELIFGRVELLPDEIPAPNNKLLWDAEEDGTQADPKIWVGIAKMPAVDALAWYENALEGTWSVPAQLAALLGTAKGRKPPPHKNLGNAVAEPPWPSLAVLQETPQVLPFIPVDLDCPRLHHRLTEDSVIGTWSEAERERAWKILDSVLHFPLAEFPVLWSSIHLVAHNPILRTVSERVVSRGDNEDVAITLIPRRGEDLTELSVTLWERRFHTTCHLATFKPSGPLTHVKLSGHRSEVAVVIDSEKHGRIYDSRPTNFIGSIEIGMQLMQAKRTVTLDRGKKGSSSYEVQTRRGANRSVIGSPAPANAIGLMRQQEGLWKSKQAVVSREEVWFVRERERAQAALREVVTRANKRVVIVDYYFNAPDVGILIPAVSSLDAEVRVLTSREGLAAAGNAKTSAKSLSKVLRQMTASLHMQEVIVRCMRGEKAGIHDRFLIVDTRAYLLGSSLNEFGSRATMLIRLQHPEKIIEHIEAFWEASRPLEEYIEGADTP